MSLSGSGLVILILLFRTFALHKIQKKVLILLWGIVVCRLLIPYSITQLILVNFGVELLSTINAEALSLATPLSNITIIDKSELIFGIWLTGSIGVGIFFIITYFLNLEKLKKSHPVNNYSANKIIQEFSLKRTVQIRQNDRIISPLTYGLFKPVIILPQNIDWNDSDKIRFILTHEILHIKKFDVLKKQILALSLSLHWFNPFIWIMFFVVNRDIELSCDESVLRKYGDHNKKKYAMILIHMEESKRNRYSLLNYFKVNTIEERLVSIMKIKKNTLVTKILSTTLLLSIATLYTTDTLYNTDFYSVLSSQSSFQYQVNETGQTFGQGPYLEGPTQEPELIKARGVNGEIGYLRITDLNSSITSPSEVRLNHDEVKKNTMIPLYKSDGITIIDQFSLNYNNN